MRDRNITFGTVFNFRDLGGYPAADGRTVRWGRLFRADDLSRLADGDRERFAALGIKTVVDLRRPNEITQDGRIPQFDGFRYQHVHLVHPQWPSQDFVGTTERVAFLLDRYREMADAAADGIGETLRLIADAESAPLVFHCIAGKDRTGIISALTLSLLGVSDEHIADDYALSEAAEAANWAWRTRTNPGLPARRWTHIDVAPRQGMLGFLDDLRMRFGGVRAYATAVGVSDDHVAAMRSHLLD